MTTALRPNSTPEALTELLRRIASQNDEEAALCALYDLVSPKLFGLALRILERREWAQEVLQEAFINIWRYAADYQTSRSAPMTWMAAIVRNRALDFLRQQKAYGASVETPWTEAMENILPAVETEPSDLLLVSQRVRQLAACMARLDAPQRRAVQLAYLSERSHAEIADVLDAPLGTVKSWVRRGLKKLGTSLAGL